MLGSFGWDRYDVIDRLGRYGRIDKIGQICWGAWVRYTEMDHWSSDTGNVQAGKGTVGWIVWGRYSGVDRLG